MLMNKRDIKSNLMAFNGFQPKYRNWDNTDSASHVDSAITSLEMNNLICFKIIESI